MNKLHIYALPGLCRFRVLYHMLEQTVRDQSKPVTNELIHAHTDTQLNMLVYVIITDRRGVEILSLLRASALAETRKTFVEAIFE